MAPNKSLWTPEMYRRMHNATSFLIAGFAVFTFLPLIVLMLLGGWFDEEILPYLLFLELPFVLSLVGLFKLRHVFADLIEEAGPVSVEHPAERVKERPERETPAAVWQQFQPEPTRMKASSPAASISRKPVTRKSEPSWASTVNWEEWVGQKLLQKLGILIVLIGMLVFLKYSFDNRWIDELGRVILSAVAAGGLLALGEIFHTKYGNWSQAFTGGGLVLLYFTVWVAHVFYEVPLAVNYGIVVPASVALVLYSFITLVGAIAAIRYNAQIIAWFTVLGGYVTPFLINAPGDSRMALLIYLAILAGGMLLLAWHQKWRYLNIAAFLFTQFYLFTSVYMGLPEFGNVEQVVTACAFFLLFNILPILYQFRLKMRADEMDIFMIIANAVAVFLPVVDALGGWESGYIGMVCLALAAFYLVFSALALNNRGDDDTLVNTYLIGTVILIAGALFAELEREWVAAGWAPLSAALIAISARLQRKGPWVCAYLLLVGSLLFLAINMPVFTATSETIWHPFTSNWAIQSYVVGASVVAWLLLSRRLPASLISKESNMAWTNALHAMIAVIAFLGVTFESTKLVLDVDLTWTFAYVAFAVVAIGIFFLTESIIWFVTAFLVQLLSLIFIFGLGEQSGMNAIGNATVQPFAHPWAYMSAFAFLSSLLMMYVARVKSHRLAAGVPIHHLITGVALAQIWVHVSVEITNLNQAYGWSDIIYDRALSGWWIVFALGILAAGVVKNSTLIRQIALGLFIIPFIHDHAAIIDGSDRMLETVVWTVLSLGIAILGARGKYRELLIGGIAFLAFTAGIDMLAHMGDATAGLVRSSWWALVGLITMIAGFMEREQLLRKVAMVVFGATAVKLLIFDFSTLETPVRIGASIATGLLMIGASYLYQRFSTAPSSSK